MSGEGWQDSRGTATPCPQCGLTNPPTALQCDCGEDLTSARFRIQRKTSWDATGISVLVVVLLFLGVLFSYLIAVRSDPPKSEPAALTSAMYNRIQTGMTYDEVVRVIGQTGQELSRNEIAGYITIMYSWQNRDGSNMNVMFQNDRVTQKAQFGLR